MQLTVNGKEAIYNVEDINGLIESLKLHRGNIVVELNGKIIPREENTSLKDKDRVEIVSFVGGG